MSMTIIPMSRLKSRRGHIVKRVLSLVVLAGVANPCSCNMTIPRFPFLRSGRNSISYYLPTNKHLHSQFHASQTEPVAAPCARILKIIVLRPAADQVNYLLYRQGSSLLPCFLPGLFVYLGADLLLQQ